jgi:hypothetical protein
MLTHGEGSFEVTSGVVNSTMARWQAPVGQASTRSLFLPRMHASVTTKVMGLSYQ